MGLRRGQGAKTFLIVCYFGAFIASSRQQQQPVEVNPQVSSKTFTGERQQKIGLAPHDRPACQLPPIATQRVRNTTPATASGSIGDTSHYDGSVNSSSVANDPIANSTSYADPLAGGISSPNVISLKDSRLLHGNIQVSARKSDSSERLRQLRQLLVSNNYDAYLVTPNDEHGNEFVPDYDRRLRFISGFTGSNGYALILLDRAVLFTDGRYALQADADLDCNWWLVVSSDPLADITTWLRLNAPKGLKIATDARLIPLQSFDLLDEQLRKLDSEFALISQDLVDVVWNAAAASNEFTRIPPQDPLYVHPLQFAGNVSWQEKLVQLSESMAKLKAKHYIISQMDDVAWLLNLRGNDVPMSPLFKAYLFISRSSNDQQPLDLQQTTRSQQQQQQQITSVEQLLGSSILQNQRGIAPQIQSPNVLQVQPSQTIKVTMYVDMNKISQQVRDHLQVDATNGTIFVSRPSATSQQQHSLESPQTVPQTTRIIVELRDYDVFIMDIRDKFAVGNRQLQGKLLLNAEANVAIHVLAKNYEDRLVLMQSLVNKLKAVKTDGEVQGMRLAHWRDSLAISMLLAQLELDIETRGLTRKWTEISAAKELEFYRSLMDHNKGQSFESISAYGSNAAIVHYSPNNHQEESSRSIGNQSVYLLDTGGQYLDGTTDITRTVHFGDPSDFQRETYTRVLMGAVDMMSLIFDQGKYKLGDLISRRHLYELGLDYAHGTGHGIGAFSMVHEAPWLLEHHTASASQLLATMNKQRGTSEGPAGTCNNKPQVLSDPVPLQANMFTSIEPGYYKTNDFGIRLENIVVTQKVDLPWSLARPNDRQETRQSLGQSHQSDRERTFLRFEPISLVAFEPKLIKFELLSNKQKAWLNSYNLMVRIRMTQQINYYLAKIRNSQATSAQQQVTGVSNQQTQRPVQVLGTRLSSKLYQSMSNNSTLSPAQQRNDSTNLATAGYYNFLRLDGAQLRAKLELAHKWIMSKTELIPLDVPRSIVSQETSSWPNPNHRNSNQPATAKPGRHNVASSNHLQGQHPALDSHRLMLAYMSSMPFNDAEAGEAIAALGPQMPSSNLLSGRMGNEASAASSADQNATSASNKCSGLECDLWLVSALGLQHSRTLRQRQQGDIWPPEEPMLGMDASVTEPPSTSLGSLMDMFKLNGSNGSGSGGWINMWPLAILSVFVVLQVGVLAYVCRRGAKRATWCSHNHRRQQQQQQPHSQHHQQTRCPSFHSCREATLSGSMPASGGGCNLSGATRLETLTVSS